MAAINILVPLFLQPRSEFWGQWLALGQTTSPLLALISPWSGTGMPEFCWTPEVTHPSPHFSLWRERRCLASKTQGLPSVAWTVCCRASPSLVPPTPPGGQTWETGVRRPQGLYCVLWLPWGSNTTGGLKQKRVLPQRPLQLLVFPGFSWFVVSSLQPPPPLSRGLFLCVSVSLPLRRTYHWILGHQDNPG